MIDLKAEHRAQLLELAQRQGEKGFSSIIADALDSYLKSRIEADRNRNKALRLRGKLSDEEAASLRRSVEHMRGYWR